jgi:uncharacterized protein
MSGQDGMVTGTGARGTGTVAAASALRERLAALSGARPAVPPRPVVPARPAVTLAGGREEETPFGPCYLIERRYPLDHQHGSRPLGALTKVAPDLLAALGGDPRLAALLHEQLVLLDTETTGLAGGTGTYVFLVGLGFLTTDATGPAFVVRQYFLRQLREERALLHALGALLAQFGALVTFNGKSFDWPLLATRYTLARQAMPAAAWPHLDLLHPARRVWRHRLPSCSLSALEAAILGVQRASDVPSALIPDLYFRYLRDGDPQPLLPVLAHNEADIVSLAALLIHLGQLAGPDGPAAYPELPGADRYGLATLQAALGRPEASIAALRAALADPPRGAADAGAGVETRATVGGGGAALARPDPHGGAAQGARPLAIHRTGKIPGAYCAGLSGRDRHGRGRARVADIARCRRRPRRIALPSGALATQTRRRLNGAVPTR